MNRFWVYFEVEPTEFVDRLRRTVLEKEEASRLLASVTRRMKFSFTEMNRGEERGEMAKGEGGLYL